MHAGQKRVGRHSRATRVWPSRSPGSRNRDFRLHFCAPTKTARRARRATVRTLVVVQYSRSITSREVFWDFGMKDLVWEWFGLLLWTSHLPKYQIQPCSHVKWPGWWLGSAIPMFPWGLNCHQLHPPPLGPPDRLRSRLNIFRL